MHADTLEDEFHIAIKGTETFCLCWQFSSLLYYYITVDGTLMKVTITETGYIASHFPSLF